MKKEYYLVVHPSITLEIIQDLIENEDDAGIFYQHWTSKFETCFSLDKALKMKEHLIENGNKRKIVKYTQILEETEK